MEDIKCQDKSPVNIISPLQQLKEKSNMTAVRSPLETFPCDLDDEGTFISTFLVGL